LTVGCWAKASTAGALRFFAASEVARRKMPGKRRRKSISAAAVISGGTINPPAFSML